MGVAQLMKLIHDLMSGMIETLGEIFSMWTDKFLMSFVLGLVVWYSE